MTATPPKFMMTIDLNVLNHLGINLYSNIPAVISEVVANAWDADAEEVLISISDSEIIIQDNGSGMDLDDINKKFLLVGYQRRVEVEGRETPIHKRPVMGRKGIGKLSLFSIANKIEVYSRKEGQANAFLMDSDEIQNIISSPSKSINYEPKEIATSSIDFEKGTRIVLKEFKKRRTIAQDSALKKRLARRFSIIGESSKFKVLLNGVGVSVEDRDYFHKIEYLWYYGDESIEYDRLATKKSKSEKRANLLNGGHRISGWLGLVKESNELTDGDDNLNKIVLLVRGKMAKEDMLEEFREGGLFSKYLFGEIRADFLDDSDQPDIATSSRQDIFEEDERYKALKDFIWSELKHIQRKREEYKIEDTEKDLASLPSINEWYKELDKDAKNRAKKFIGKINQIAMDEKHKKQLISHGVLAFESFRYKGSLDSLEKVSLENLDEFLKIFREFDEIDATLYYKITEGRLGVIKELRDKIDENALEKALQQLLFDHLWLLDPSWERSTDNPIMEQRVDTEFKKVTASLTDEERKGRMDIKYKTPVGKHIIVELKRASVKTSSYDLQRQVDKYIRALEKVLKEEKPGETPIIEAICVVGKPLEDWDTTEHTEQTINSMAAKRTRVVTYQSLIQNSARAYGEYLEQSKKSNNLLRIIQNIERDIEE